MCQEDVCTLLVIIRVRREAICALDDQFRETFGGEQIKVSVSSLSGCQFLKVAGNVVGWIDCSKRVGKRHVGWTTTNLYDTPHYDKHTDRRAQEFIQGGLTFNRVQVLSPPFPVYAPFQWLLLIVLRVQLGTVKMSRPSEVYVRPLSTEEEQWVHRLYQQTTHVGLKSRCHIILLSTQHYSVQHPVLSVSSPDPEYEQKCARLQNLQQRALAGEIDLYYEDEVDLALLPVECR